MDELPELLSEAVGDGAVINTVDIGGGDVVTVTRNATYVYRSDGLLSDESVEPFEHDIERLSMRTKRRKSEVQLETIDSERSFTVPSKTADPIVEAMVEGVLRTNGVVETDEEVLAQFRFSELTLLVTDRRLFEHVGSAVWDDDFEAVEYAELTGLDFEKGSVATQVVIETDERRRRVKVPNEHAGRVRREIQEAVFGFYEVASLEALRAELSEETDQSKSRSETAVDAAHDGKAGSSAGSQTAAERADENASEDSFVSADWTPSPDRNDAGSRTEAADTQRREAASASVQAEPDASVPGEDERERPATATDPDIDALTGRVDTLSEQVQRQTELIESQQELIEQLVDELRRGR